MSPWCVPAPSLTLTRQETAAFCRPVGQKREERDSYSVTSAPRWDPSQHRKPPPRTGSSRMLGCLNWRSAERWREEDRGRGRKRRTRGEGKKNKGEGEKKTKSERAHFGRISSGWRGEERLMVVGAGGCSGSTLQTCNCMSAELRLAVVISVHINCAFSLVSSVEHQTVLLEWMYASKQKFRKKTKTHVPEADIYIHLSHK